MKTNRLLAAALCFSFPPPLAMAQLVQTDAFDFWEDQATHSFTASGITYSGAYICGSDSTLRCGDCFNGTGAASVVLQVEPNADTVLLTFLLGWAGGNTVVTMDGLWLGTITTSGVCSWDSLLLTNASPVTADSFVTVVVRDTIPGCTGDIQVARMAAFSSAASPAGIQSASGPGSRLHLFPNPASTFLCMTFPGPVETKCVLVISDLQGRQGHRQELQPVNGNTMRVDLPPLAAGIYRVDLLMGQRILCGKLAIR